MLHLFLATAHAATDLRAKLQTGHKDKIMVVRYLVSFLDQPELKTFSWIPMITEHTHTINVIWTQTTKPADQRVQIVI